MLLAGNYSHTRFRGMIPATVLRTDNLNAALVYAPAARPDTGEALPPVPVFLGPPQGLGRSCWIGEVDLEPGQMIGLDMANAVPAKFAKLPEVPLSALTDPAGMFQPAVNGLPLALIPHSADEPFERDGCALRGHWRARVSFLVWCDFFLAWVPGEPWARFEVLFNAANPVQPLTSEVLRHGFTLTVGNGVVGFLGQRFGVLLEGETIAHGQARAFSGIVYWPDLGSADHEVMAAGLLTGSPVAVDQRFRDLAAGMGVPERSTGFDPRRFVASTFPEAMQIPYRWNPHSKLGVAARSANTGAQEDQCFSARGTECFGTDIANLIASQSRYLVAMDMAKRPCMFREADGTLLDFDAHPRLVFWDGRPHWHTGVSPDQLGMPALPSNFETHGWYGPDRQHWFYGSLWLAATLRRSPVLQMLLETQARIVLFQETTEPRLSTSGSDAARAVGWFGILATALWTTLANRDTANRVRRRAMDRVRLVYERLRREGQPAMWHILRDDRLSKDLAKHYEDIQLLDGTVIPRADELPPGGVVSFRTVYHYPNCWMPWQQAVGSFGLHLLGKVFHMPEAIEIAEQGARAVVEFAYTEGQDGSLKEWEVLGVPEGGGALPASEMVQGKGAHSSGMFRHAWMPLASWTLLQTVPDHPRAQRIQGVLRQEALGGNGVLSWLPPLDRPVAVLP